MVLKVVLTILLISTSSGFITQRDGKLFDGTDEFFFSGVNIFWLGSGKNGPDFPYQEAEYNHPSYYRIDDVLQTAKFMGAKVVRSHSIGVSTGNGSWHAYGVGWPEGMVMPHLGEFNTEVMDSADYAVYRAGQLGLRLVIPLTDEWNYLGGGIADYLGPLGLLDLEGAENNCVCNINQNLLDPFYTDEEAIQYFRQYVRTILEHENKYTGLAYKDDPTILAWETGNELYYPSLNWTISLANFIKAEVGAKQLVMDGRLVSATGFYSEFSEGGSSVERYRASVDLVSDHAYPMQLDTLEELSAFAKDVLRLPFILGEIEWSGACNGNSDIALEQYLQAVEQLREGGYVTGSLFWSLFGHGERFGEVTHDDGLSMYWPTGPEPGCYHYNSPAFRGDMKEISDHMYRMASVDIPSSYDIADTAPVFDELACNPGMWILLTFRGVAGAHLYRIDIDGLHMSFIEDRQLKPTYIHNSVVTAESIITITPLGYGVPAKQGNPVSMVCPPAK